MIHAVVAYDVSGDDVRAKLAAMLSKLGVRLQRSVFFCSFPDADRFDDAVQTLRAMIDVDRDVLHLFRQCSPCGDERIEIGQARPMIDTPYWIV